MQVSRLRPNRGRFTVAVMLAVLCYLAAPPLTYASHVDCGDTIGPGRLVRLDQDLFCDSDDPGLTVIGPVIFDMNGHEIDCDFSASTCILVQGARATVRNGRVVNADGDGIEVAGTGGHTIANMEVASNLDDGISVDSNRNRILRNFVHDNDDDGVQVDSDFNTLAGNRASENGESGIDLNGNSNSATSNQVLSNEEEGFDVDGDRNNVLLNTVGNNDFHNISVSGDNNRITRNIVTAGFFDGINVSGDGNTIVGNQVNLHDDEGIEIEITGDNNTVLQNTVTQNEDSGIEVSGSGNRIMSNTSVNNNLDQDTDEFDLLDDNPNCGSNIWRGNTFVTSNQPCIS